MFWQFVLLGTITMLLTSGVDLVLAAVRSSCRLRPERFDTTLVMQSLESDRLQPQVSRHPRSRATIATEAP